MKLRLSPDFAIDTDAYKREGLRISILAMSGHGKSNAAADIVEDVLDNDAQVIIIEPIPEWHTLKARYNNVVVIGGPYQDLPLEPAFAHEYVLAALEKGISLVVNVSDIEEDADQVRFVSSFLWNLYRLEQKYRRVIFLVLEEADTWAPQNWDQTTKPSLSRVSLIAKHGRKIGIFPILVSQRPADLHKSPLSQCNVNLFGKFTSPADLDPKTGIMYIVKKLHLPINEEMIMKLSTGSFVVSHKGGVDTISVRKRLCPHGADTPLFEAKPFAADVSQALGGLRDEIARAIAAKKDEDSLVKRQEKQILQLKEEVKELAAKANIKLSVKEMMEGPPLQTAITVPGTVSMEDKSERDKLEKRVKFLESVKDALEKDLQKAEQNLRDFGVLKGTLSRVLEIGEMYEHLENKLGQLAKSIPKASQMPPTGTLHGNSAMGLQHVVTVLDLEEVKKTIPKVPTDTVKGKILALAKNGFFKSWQSVGDISAELVEQYRFNTSDQAINGALKELVDSQILGMKHTDRNRWKLAPDVVFEGKKEVER